MATFRATLIPSRRFLYTPVSALVLWACLWCNLNTGFWNIGMPNSLTDLLTLIRAVLPWGVLPISVFMLLRHQKLRLPKTAPSRLLLFYAGFAALATFFSPGPVAALYWSCAFLATIFAAWTFVDGRHPLESARQMLVITWVATFIVAAIIGYRARGMVFTEAGSAYNVLSDLNGLSRSSGVARWAAVPGLVCLVRAYYTRRRMFIALYLGGAAVCYFIIYRMQSRGAVFGVVAALIFSLLVSSKMRRYALPFALIAIIGIVILESPTGASKRVSSYLMRGQDKAEFLSMTGRTRAYHLGVAVFEESPILGRGQWADRMTINEHVHNSFLMALMNSGILGGIPYFASWGAGWLLFYRLQKGNAQLLPEDRIHLMECGAVMMFFTVRAIPETTTAGYSVDLLVMVAVYVYLELLTLKSKTRKLSLAVPHYYLIKSAAPISATPARSATQRLS